MARHPCLLIVRSPFGAKHHVVVQYMARWMKCPLPPPPTPLPLSPTPLPLPQPPTPTPSPCWTPLPHQTPLPSAGPPTQREDKEDKEESMTLPAQGTSHCSCLEQTSCLVFSSSDMFAPTISSGIQNVTMRKIFELARPTIKPQDMGTAGKSSHNTSPASSGPSAIHTCCTRVVTAVPVEGEKPVAPVSEADHRGCSCLVFFSLQWSQMGGGGPSTTLADRILMEPVAPSSDDILPHLSVPRGNCLVRERQSVFCSQFVKRIFLSSLPTNLFHQTERKNLKDFSRTSTGSVFNFNLEEKCHRGRRSSEELVGSGSRVPPGVTTG